MPNGGIPPSAPDVNGRMWTKVQIRISRDSLEWMCEHQARDGGGVQNGGVKLRQEPKNDEFNQSALAIGTEAQHTTDWAIWRVVTTVADKMAW